MSVQMGQAKVLYEENVWVDISPLDLFWRPVSNVVAQCQKGSNIKISWTYFLLQWHWSNMVLLNVWRPHSLLSTYTYIHIAFGFLVDSLCEIKGVVIIFFFFFFFRRYIEKHALDEEDSHWTALICQAIINILSEWSIYYLHICLI